MRAAMADDLMRSLGRGRPWILMEQTTSRVNWREVNVAKEPGQARLWSYQALARGADGIMYFQWRQSQAGAEKFHSAFVPHGPPEGSSAWLEARQLGAELRELDRVAGARVKAEVAILLDWDSWWALEQPSKPSGRLKQMEQIESYYAPLFEANVTADFARPVDDLSPYRLVLAPNLYLVSREAAANLRDYVERGGHLLISFFSGIVDPDDHVWLGGYPAPLAEVLGVSVVDWYPLAPNATVGIRLADGTLGVGDVWSEQIRPSTAEVLGRFAGGRLDGEPAFTRNLLGRGSATYLGTRPEPVVMSLVLRDACAMAGVTPVLEAPPGVEAVRRGAMLFLLNHGEAPAEVRIGALAVRLGSRDIAVVDLEMAEKTSR